MGNDNSTGGRSGVKGKESGKHEHQRSYYSLLESQNRAPCAMLLLLLCHNVRHREGKEGK